MNTTVTHNRTIKLSDVELAELRSLEAYRVLAAQAAKQAEQYLRDRLVVVLGDHGVTVDATSTWQPDLVGGVVVETKAV